MDVIRKVETTDVDIIYDYEKLFFKDYWSKDQILIEITNNNAFNLVFEKDSRLVAYIFTRNSVDFVEILKPRLNHIKRGIAHCFTGTEVELEALLDLGLYIGITGWICDERLQLDFVRVDFSNPHRIFSQEAAAKAKAIITASINNTQILDPI